MQCSKINRLPIGCDTFIYIIFSTSNYIRILGNYCKITKSSIYKTNSNCCEKAEQK